MIPEPPLIIPFLPNVGLGGPLPVTPVRIASWSTTAEAGPSKRLAVAGTDNTVWILTSDKSAPESLPELLLPDAAAGRPSSSRHVSSASTGTFTFGRPRAGSSTSSIMTTTSLRRVLSPTAASTTLSSATVTAAAPDAHVPRASVSEHADLIHQLREQAAEAPDERSGLGFGLGGLGRRGVSTAQPKEPKDGHSTGGASTPLSTGSSESRGISATISGIMGRNSEDEAAKEQRRAKIDEMAVEQEMIREEAEDEREAEDMKIVEKAPRPQATPTPGPSEAPSLGTASPPMRIVLPEPGRGSIVDLAVLEEVGELVVLRDVGLLDVLNLSNLQLTKHISLDHAAPPGSRTPKLAPSWLWQRVHLAAREEGALVIANGVPWPSPWPSPNGEVTRVAMLALPEHDCVANLELPGLGDVGVTSNSEASYILHATPTSLMSYAIEFPQSPPGSRSSTPVPPSHSSSTTGSPHLGPNSARRIGALANVRSTSGSSTQDTKQSGLAKFLAARRMTSKKPDTDTVQSAAGVKQGIEVQRDGGGHWFSVRLHDSGQGIGLGDGHVEAFDFDGKKLSVRGSIPVPTGIAKDVLFSTGWNDVVIGTDNDTVLVFGQDGGAKDQKWTLRKELPGHEVCMGTRHLYVVGEKSITDFELSSLKNKDEVKITKPVAGDHICPMGASKLFVASDDELRECGSSQYLHNERPTDDKLAYPLDATITYSTLIKAENATGGRFLVMGDVDGAVHIWDAQTLQLRGSWTLFDDHVRSATLLDMQEAGSLQGTLLCTSARGCVGIISLSDMEQLYLIPAARAPLTRIYIGGDDILLAYEIQKARVWNVVTGEFRRSTGLDSADDMLNTKGWAEVRFQAAPPLDSPVSKVVGPLPFGADLGRLLQLDLRELGKWLSADKDSSTLPALRGLLSAFLTFGINAAIDEVCTTHLGITRPAFPVAIGLEGPHGTATVAYTSPEAAWQVSPTVTGLRQLAIISLLRPFLDSPDYDQHATDVVAFYSASLPENAAEADLELFAAFYLDSASDVHQAARMLFGARLSRMPNEEIEKMVATQQSLLPAAVLPHDRMSEASARALTMVGGMALHRFSCMNPKALKSVAQSIAMYLDDPKCIHVDLAIELCSKGFSTWQTYVDPMKLLRRLFFLSTQKEHGPSLAAQARLAVLHVASTNAPLFMSTLSMDIMDAQTVEDRTSIMKLCIYLARKRPTLLENGLPRIAEAVVKSIDPNVGKMRDHVWEAATEILRELVSAFSSIDFNSSTQRLAVGTAEGAVIMYDLKTASRLYVLEPHTHPVSAVSFFPDGRRLVTVSLDEGDMTVWKVGSSLSGFFNVGGPPRQGGKPGEPYRRFPIFRAGTNFMAGTEDGEDSDQGDEFEL